MEKNGQDNSASNRCTSCGKPINLSDGKRLCADCDNDEDDDMEPIVLGSFNGWLFKFR